MDFLVVFLFVSSVLNKVFRGSKLRSDFKPFEIVSKLKFDKIRLSGYCDFITEARDELNI